MIFHNCIKCEYLEVLSMPEHTPIFSEYICPECEEKQYIKFSRIDTITYSKDMLDINEENKTIKVRGK